MKTGQLYRHRRNTTIAFEMIEGTLFDGVWHLKVAWWNVGACHLPWHMNIMQDIKIPSSRTDEWVIMEFTEKLHQSVIDENCKLEIGFD